MICNISIICLQLQEEKSCREKVKNFLTKLDSIPSMASRDQAWKQWWRDSIYPHQRNTEVWHIPSKIYFTHTHTHTHARARAPHAHVIAHWTTTMRCSFTINFLFCKFPVLFCDITNSIFISPNSYFVISQNRLFDKIKLNLWYHKICRFSPCITSIVLAFIYFVIYKNRFCDITK